MKNAAYYINKLELVPHPEGGYYKEVYRDLGVYPPHQSFRGERNYSTSIYYLLEANDHSCFHSIKSDETWHHYDGGCVLIHFFEEGQLITKKLGKNLDNGEVPQITIPKNHWFAAEPDEACDFALMGCTVAPGFDFKDFQMATEEDLTEFLLHHTDIINRLTQ